MGDADVRRPLDRRRRPTSSTGRNLAKGQTGLSVAFDLPTQTGYDPDSPLARGEVGKVGVPVPHLGEMRRLFEDIPLDRDEHLDDDQRHRDVAARALPGGRRGAEPRPRRPRRSPRQLAGTTQNDIIKEYLSRGTYVFPPEHSLRLIADVISYTVHQIPKWNPINICSYHLQEAGATPTQELAYALSTAIAVLDAGAGTSGQVSEDDFEKVVGRISFFVNAGVRFVEETCKMRAFVRLWDEITRERYGVQDPKMRRFRYGVQVNSLGLTEAQPENNVQRIVLEMLGVTLSKNARARAVQLPAWNEALGLPRPWDQQWSLRLQQVLAFESDLLEYDDIFEGSHVIEAKVAELVDGRARRDRPGAGDGRRDRGRRVRLHEAGAGRARTPRAARRIESGEEKVVGVNVYETTEPSPLTADLDAAIQAADPEAERSALAGRRGLEGRSATRPRSPRRSRRLGRGRQDRHQPDGRPRSWPPAPARPRGSGPARCARCSASSARPTGVSGAVGVAEAGRRARPRSASGCGATGEELGGRLRLLVGKPGLDGHSNGAEQVAVRARDAGFEVDLPGHPADARADRRRGRRRGRALRRPLDPVRLAHGAGARRARRAARGRARRRAGDRRRDHPRLRRPARCASSGVAAVYTPKDFGLTEIMGGIVDVIRRANGLD